MFTDVKIYFSVNNGEEVLVLPITPATLPEIVQTFDNQTFTTNSLDLTLIGNFKSKTINTEFLLPINKNYRSIQPDANKDGKIYIDFFEKYTKEKLPLRLVITEGEKTLLNIAITVNKFTYSYDKKKDIICALEMSEYMFTQKQAENTAKYNWTDVTIKYCGSGYKTKGANINGHWLLRERKVLELMGYDVTWNADEKSIYVNGDYRVKTEHTILDSSAYCYLYKLGEELNFTAEYDKSKNIITINKKWDWTEITIMKNNRGVEVWASNDLGHYIVQAKPLLELMGYAVTWNSSEKAIYLDNWIKLQSKLIIINGVSYAYLYQVCNELNFTSEYDIKAHKVTIEQHIWTEITVRYNYKGYEVWASNIDGHWLGQVGPILYTMGIEYKEKDGTYYVEEQPIKTPIHKKNDGYYCYIYQLCEEFNFTAEYDATKKYIYLKKKEK